MYTAHIIIKALSRNILRLDIIKGDSDGMSVIFSVSIKVEWKNHWETWEKDGSL